MQKKHEIIISVYFILVAIVFILGSMLIVISLVYAYKNAMSPLASNPNIPTTTELPTIQPSNTDYSQLFIDNNVPFTPQAPFADWDDPRQQDGCEEASVLMAMSWVHQTPLSRDDALREILAMTSFEEETYGSNRDTSAQDTVDWLIKDYYGFDAVGLRYDVTVDDIKDTLAAGSIVLIPADGRALKNPNFSGAGPEYHMILIRGYDGARKEFITNDPGTRKGEAYRYSEQVITNAMRDYPTGVHQPIPEKRSAMIIISK